MSFQCKRRILQAGFIVSALSAPFAFTAAARAQLPAIMAYGERSPYQTISAPTKLARDAAGDVFVISGGNVYELPASGPMQIVLPSSDPAASGMTTMTADPAGDLYIGHNGNTVTEVTRNANGTYNLGASSEVTVGITNLVVPADGYFYTASDIAVDSVGNVFMIVTTNPAVSGGANGGGIYMSGPSAPNGQFLLGSFTAKASPFPTSLNLDASNNLFYADGSFVWEVPATTIASGAPVASKIGSSTMTTPTYVFPDPAGNLYVGNNSNADYVIVNSASGFTTANATYTLPGTIVGHSGYNYGVFDNQGNLIMDFGNSLEFYGGSKIYIDSGTNNYATTTATGGAGSSTTNNSGASIGLLFTATETLNATAPIVVNAGGSFYGAAGTASNTFNSGSNTNCVAGTTYTAGQTCLIEIGYKAYQPGIFASGVNIYGGASSSATNLLTSINAFGIATGPAVAIDTGLKTAIGTGFTMPTGIAVDNAGAMYVADSTANTVYKFAAGSTGAATATYGTGLSAPSGVAIDQAGNLYIADTGNNRVVYLPNNSGTLGAQKVLGTSSYSLSSPRGLAVDGFGNIYIADTGNGRVLMATNPLAGTVGTSYTVGSGFTSPYGVAVDKLNNVYVADKAANAVYKVPGGYGLTSSSTANTGAGAIVTVGSGYSSPTGVAVDASGTVYVADGGNSRIVKVPYVGTAFGTATVLFSQASGGLARPFGLAMDLTGDLYFTDTDLPNIYFAQRSAASGAASTLAFGSVATGGTSTLTATLSNVGYTTALTESLSTSPATPYSLSNNGCSSASPLATGASCGVAVTFTGPSTTDTNQAGTMAFTTNALNATTSPTTGVTLSGESTGVATAVAITGDTSIVYGETETYTVTAKDASGALSAASSDNGGFTVNITGTATGTAPVTLSGGTGTFLLPSLGVGNYSLTITVGGVAATPLSVTVAKAPLVATATSVSRIFDTPNPIFGYSLVGLANGDTSSVVSGGATVTTNATRVSPYGTYTLTTAGSLSASNYTITYATGTLSVTGSVPQMIVFNPLPAMTHGVAYTLTNIATSGLPVSYEATNATVNGNVITPTAAGTVTVSAIQSGNSTYAAASGVTRTFTAQ